MSVIVSKCLIVVGYGISIGTYISISSAGIEYIKPRQVEMLLVYNEKKFSEEYKYLHGSWKIDSFDFREDHFNHFELKDSGIPEILVITNKAPAGIEKRCDIYYLEIDPTTSPKRLTITVAGGEIKGYQSLGIYQGKADHLTIKFSAIRTKSFPKDFSAIPEDDGEVMKLTRRQ